MSIAETLLPEFDHEMKTTRKVLERVPDDKGGWKPHTKSFSMGHLAQLLAIMPNWLTTMLRETELDLAAGKGYTLETTKDLLAVFDGGVRDGRKALAAATDRDFSVPWSLRMGEMVLFTEPRGKVVREHINHMVHHRGQMTVYLRMVDVPVPSIYGPSADEGW